MRRRLVRLLIALGCAVGGVVTSALVGAQPPAVRVVVGAGIAEGTVRQVVRAASGVVYVFAPDDTAQRQAGGPGVLRAYRASGRGRPSAFVEVDGVHRPAVTGNDVLYAPDVRLDRHGLAEMVYGDQAGGVYFQAFSTASDRWGPRLLLAQGAVANPGFYARPTRVYRNWASYGLVLDRADRPHVVYCSGNGVFVRSLGAGGWSAPRRVAQGRSPLHVQLASDRRGGVYATWLDDPLGSAAVMFARLTPDGSPGAPELVDSGSPNVLNNATDDQGPSIVVTASGKPYLLYLRGTTDGAGRAVSSAVVRFRRDGRWVDDSPPASAYGITHSPQLYSRGDDLYLFLGHDAALHWGYLVQRAGRGWSRYTVLDSAGEMDGSVSVRWDPPRDTDPRVIDAVHHDEDYRHDNTYLPRLYYQSVMP